MSTDKNGGAVTLDADAVRKLIEGMQPDALRLFRDVIVDVRERGNSLSDVVVNELAKKYADKARKLVGAGSD